MAIYTPRCYSLAGHPAHSPCLLPATRYCYCCWCCWEQCALSSCSAAFLASHVALICLQEHVSGSSTRVRGLSVPSSA